MTIPEALQRSREAHDRYREALPRRVANGSGGTVAVEGDAITAGQALAEACKWRAEAHVLDVKQADPAWADEAVSYDHMALLDFYVEQLTREPMTVQAATPTLPATVAEAVQALTPLPVPILAATPPVLVTPPAGV